MNQLTHMTDALIHRGPDGEGHWISESGKVGLGHRRLSIIDLSLNGAQPMHYKDDLVITFNGEIYNYLELKTILEGKGFVFKTNCDTEVLLIAYKFWGVKCLNHLDGMFAFAIYDVKKDELFLARDRFGEKPFYYACHADAFYFASEMKALWAVGVPRKVKESMVYNYLANDLVENPNDQCETFYEGIYKLKSGSYFYYTGGDVTQKRYWEIDFTSSSHVSFEDATIRFRELFELSISRRLRSDVLVGTSLSGGLDSSSIVSEVSKLSQSVCTFSARFPGFVKDEGTYIDIVNKKYHSTHHNVRVDAELFINQIDRLVFHQEEPFQSGSIFAQFKVYEAARKHNIVVMLDGQGADEYLCGYEKDYHLITLNYLTNICKYLAYKKSIRNNHGIKIRTPKPNLALKVAPWFYKSYRYYRDTFVSFVPIGINPEFHNVYRPKLTPFQQFDSLKGTLIHEMTNQGLEKLLRFADRNSMAHSVEVRLPFLYHDLVEFVLSLPEYFLLNGGWSKAILRNAMKEDLPPEIVYRKDKIGFEAPTKMWTANRDLVGDVERARSSLISNGIITAAYNDYWKIVILDKFL